MCRFGPWILAAAWGIAVLLDPRARIDFPLDDAWIHVAYAVGLLRDGLPTYNPGVPEAGFSSPLWLVVLLPIAAALPLGAGTVVMLAKGLSLACMAATAAVVGRIAGRYGPVGSRGLAIVLVSLQPGLAFAAASGMEVALASFVLALGLERSLQGRWRDAGVWFGLAGLARPECGVVLLGVLAWVAARRREASSMRVLAALLAPSIVLASVWLAYDFAVTGHPAPNTFRVKALHGSLGQNFAFLAEAVSSAGWGFAVLTAVCSLAGVAYGWTRDRAATVLLVMAVVLPVAAIVFTHALVPGVDFYMRRYLHPFVPLLAAWTAIGALAIGEAVRGARGRLVAAAVMVLAGLSGLLDVRHRLLRHCEDVHVLHTRPALDFIARTGPGTRVAVEGAGAARVFGGEAVIVDLEGLNDHWIAAAKGPGARACAALLREPEAMVVPAQYLRGVADDYDMRVIAEYRVEHWSVFGDRGGRSVVTAIVWPKPTVLAACRARAEGLPP